VNHLEHADASGALQRAVTTLSQPFDGLTDGRRKGAELELRPVDPHRSAAERAHQQHSGAVTAEDGEGHRLDAMRGV
jgi:hypothetical protein